MFAYEASGTARWFRGRPQKTLDRAPALASEAVLVEEVSQEVKGEECAGKPTELSARLWFNTTHLLCE